MLAPLAGRIHDYAPQQNAFPLGDTTGSMSQSSFLWSDAWLLQATAHAESAALWSVLFAGDMINKAMFTSQELNGGIGRLSRAGLLTYASGELSLTDAGRKLFLASAADAKQSSRGSMLDEMHAIGRRLGAPEWSSKHDPGAAGVGEDVVVSDVEFQAAEKLHSRAFWKMVRDQKLLDPSMTPDGE